jgi:hypothetical protein
MHDVQCILDDSVIISPGSHAWNVKSEKTQEGRIEGQDMESTGSWPSRPSRNHNLISLTFYPCTYHTHTQHVSYYSLTEAIDEDRIPCYA